MSMTKRHLTPLRSMRSQASLSIARGTLRSWSAETVPRIMSKLPACLAVARALRDDDLVGSEPLAVGTFPSEVVNRTV